MLADFGQTGGIAVTQALMELFAQRLAQEFANDLPRTDSVDPGEETPREPARPQPSALSVRFLLWSVLKDRFSVLGSWMKRLRARS